jgi:hypothetical protein
MKKRRKEKNERESESKGQQRREANIPPFMRKRNHALSPLSTKKREHD